MWQTAAMDRGFLALIGTLPLATFGGTWLLASPPQRPHAAAEAFYAGCSEARAAGAAPLLRGQPGYRIGMDGDGDGIACETHVGRAAIWHRRFGRRFR